MKRPNSLFLFLSALLFSAVSSFARIEITVNRNDNDQAAPSFTFKKIPAPQRDHAAVKAAFALVDGSGDPNGGGLDKLHDGRLPTGEDQPEENFFFAAGSDGGRVRVDLGTVIEVQEVRTYSWHVGARAPQAYELYATDGSWDGFDAAPKRGKDPAACGWRLIAKVDTRPKSGPSGGQYAVSIADSGGFIGKYRQLLFDIARTEDADPFGNTFYSEIAVIDRRAPAAAETAAVASEEKHEYEMDAAKYRFVIDTTKAPALTEWAKQTMAPVVREWYPKLVQMLPSDGYEAPTNFSIVFSTNASGLAATSGRRITGNARWYQQNLRGEAVGSIVHELVHVVQQYGSARRDNPDATRSPGWLVEGIPDYLRWYKFEPQSHGADISRRGFDRARYDLSYRVSANFLNWVVESYDQEIVLRLNAAMREGKYSEALWMARTGHTVQELGGEWKEALQAKLGVGSGTNSLSDAEKAGGWQLLFNGLNLNGWHNFKAAGVRAGWQVKDGALVCADPHNAGDIVTSNKFDWFELQLDYNIAEAGNSGIMYHVTEEGQQVWATGPEVQIEDNAKARDPQRCGWLYGLYQPEIDPKTGKPVDATKPVGEWNHVRLLITPQRCEHDVNGVKYFQYVLHSDDFNNRVARSKFGMMPGFAKDDLGYLALQGDHGSVSFRNIKIRKIESK